MLSNMNTLEVFISMANNCYPFSNKRVVERFSEITRGQNERKKEDIS